MKKILISLATTFVATTLLVACNGSGTNSSDITSEEQPLAKAVCTSLRNWKEVGIGMSAAQVEARLGKPAKIATTQTTTTYTYERCRGFVKIVSEGTAATPTTPAVEPKYTVIQVEGGVTISSARGVTSVATPERIKETILCELDYYNYTDEQAVCRTSTNPF
jgi:hypothetical protein